MVDFGPDMILECSVNWRETHRMRRLITTGARSESCEPTARSDVNPPLRSLTSHRKTRGVVRLRHVKSPFLIDDQSRTPVEGKERPCPLQHNQEAVAEAGQVVDVH